MVSSKASLDDVISHWCTLIEGLQASPLEFYNSVEAALQRREVPETKNDRVDYNESGILTSKREYLHVTREKLTFDICGAPFGTGFFVSWWLSERKLKLHPVLKVAAILGMVIIVFWIIGQLGFWVGAALICFVVFGSLYGFGVMASNGELDDDVICELPILGRLYTWLFRATTFYRIDTLLMFQKAVHNAVLEVIDDLTTTKGLRALGEPDRKPIMREFYQRKVA